MTILKTNELARIFSTELNFNMLVELLEGPCTSNGQIGYNVIALFWILSSHDYTHEYFENYNLAILEKVSKILDYCSWEKIARIMLMLFDNLKENEGCQDQFSDIDALRLLEKLDNRHWVDEDINNMLEKLIEYFNQNQKVFSSIEKFRNQVERKQLRWGPCHTETFW